MNGRQKFLCRFDSEQEAARVYDRAAQELFGVYAVELMGELKDVFLALPKEQKEALMDKHERSISKGMEEGIMPDWTVVMEAAIECSGLLEDLEMLKEGGDDGGND